MAYNEIEDIYHGSFSSLDPNAGNLFTGYRTNVNSLGISTDPRTANILKEVSDKIAPGQKVVELSLISPEILEAIPRQDLEEVRRLSKLTGAEVTVHGPLVDASGVGQQGFDDQQREITERKILHALERSHDINPHGNIPVTFHTANQLPGTRYKKEGNKETIEFMPVVNQETGQISVVKPDEKFYLGQGEEKYDANKSLRILNNTKWSESLDQVEFNRENADRIMQEVHPTFITRYAQYESNQLDQKSITPEEYEQFKKISSAKTYLDESYKAANALFNQAYKYGNQENKDEIKNALNELSKNYAESTGINKEGKIEDPYKYFNPRNQSEALFKLRRVLGDEKIRPQVYKSAEKYALEKSFITYGNAAWQSYQKFGESSPIISIENPPAGFGLSRGADVRDLVEGSKKQFIENAIKSGKMSEKEAQKQADKLIGVTWDVGHINQLRQYGFSGKDIVEEAGKVKPLVKHVHLSDNFGMENTELPMGMGNVDLKEVMDKLGKQGEDARKIVEAAHWWQHKQSSPMGPTFEAMGSQVYRTDIPGSTPYWNQVTGLQPGYFGGYGQTFPQINYETFGAGFSQLPSDLGGQTQGGSGSRMSGRGLE
ncbi:MAG: TIM barrel protein [Candidatus Pacearchaeota archaeon]